ncbi:MAG: hypothetical protein K2W95_29035 [Candidatus Obscuribacterales bacterium]|nr:hypothetical protein [Candidatus Obscuribacterales bacterium]
MKTFYQTSRRRTGNIIILCCVLFAMIALAIVVAYSFCSLYFVHNRLESSANEIALAGAKKLNEKDRLGQMNNMLVRCRQLVYSSRQDLEKTEKEFKDLESFARPLLDESRASAMYLETERKNLTETAKKEATIAMQQQFDSIKPGYQVTLPWLRISQPQMPITAFGKIDGLQCNVEELTGIAALAGADRTADYVDAVSPLLVGVGPIPGAAPKGLNLYKAEKDHKLEGKDSDLSFKLSCLPAPVNGVISPARILLMRTFRDTVGSEFAPSAARVVLKLKVESGLGPRAGAEMESRGASLTNGASAQL